MVAQLKSALKKQAPMVELDSKKRKGASRFPKFRLDIFDHMLSPSSYIFCSVK
jgi:hypothetical protein